MNVMMITCPYCGVQQPARVNFTADVDLARDNLPDTIAVTTTADLRAAKTHAQTCKSRRARG